jgi:hypothetical protein
MYATHYFRLAAMAVLSFVAMYILMYSMVNESPTCLPTTINFTWRV